MTFRRSRASDVLTYAGYGIFVSRGSLTGTVTTITVVRRASGWAGRMASKQSRTRSRRKERKEEREREVEEEERGMEWGEGE